MASVKNKEEAVVCPVGCFLRDVEKKFGKKSKFLDHMTQSRIEVLKAIRSLVDERIDQLDKKNQQKVIEEIKIIRLEKAQQDVKEELQFLQQQ